MTRRQQNHRFSDGTTLADYQTSVSSGRVPESGKGPGCNPEVAVKARWFESSPSHW